MYIFRSVDVMSIYNSFDRPRFSLGMNIHSCRGTTLIVLRGIKQSERLSVTSRTTFMSS